MLFTAITPNNCNLKKRKLTDIKFDLIGIRHLRVIFHSVEYYDHISVNDVEADDKCQSPHQK